MYTNQNVSQQMNKAINLLTLGEPARPTSYLIHLEYAPWLIKESLAALQDVPSIYITHLASTPEGTYTLTAEVVTHTHTIQYDLLTNTAANITQIRFSTTPRHDDHARASMPSFETYNLVKQAIKRYKTLIRKYS